ncbi:Uncharacterised protein [Cellulomonas fimi]|nr:Uncharacterised protein [Cellulomonas fimi]
MRRAARGRGSGARREEVLAAVQALRARSVDEALARRGRLPGPGGVSDLKGRVPIALGSRQGLSGARPRTSSATKRRCASASFARAAAPRSTPSTSARQTR